MNKTKKPRVLCFEAMEQRAMLSAEMGMDLGAASIDGSEIASHQRDHRLDDDGIFGPKTISSIRKQTGALRELGFEIGPVLIEQISVEAGSLKHLREMIREDHQFVIRLLVDRCDSETSEAKKPSPSEIKKFTRMVLKNGSKGPEVEYLQQSVNSDEIEIVIRAVSVDCESAAGRTQHPDFAWNPRTIRISPPDHANDEAEKRIPAFLRHRERVVLARIPTHTPEWTNPGPGDPG